MDRRMFGILLFSGLFHVAFPLHRPRYNFINKSKTWLEARQHCREYHTDLAAVNDEQDLMDLGSLVDSEFSHVFIGLQRSWRWSVSDADNHKEGDPSYRNWARDEPEAAKHCGVIRFTGEWFAASCNTRRQFICYNESTTDLSERIVLNDDFMDWASAQAYCREWHTDLARVRNQLDNEALQGLQILFWTWIGLNAESWAWSDGREASFIPWRPQELLGVADCAALDVNSRPLGIVDKDCAEKLPFFCYTEPRKKYLVEVKLTADDSVDMTDQAVLDSILKTVETKLGATTDVQLRWKKLPELEENSKQ
ncbi:hypothetical protein KUCAC02_000367 [Chaenocephalus aceratus]|uniref:Uncharacterized protein n=1 Tax=Chaenocephalus aceratus TaxID=36190 RepID=A0ACB9W6T9_CHAAC|nr:hypothetical protein KUCAC02_000367 [Chaenocephalus aceratus]